MISEIMGYCTANTSTSGSQSACHVEDLDLSDIITEKHKKKRKKNLMYNTRVGRLVILSKCVSYIQGVLKFRAGTQFIKLGGGGGGIKVIQAGMVGRAANYGGQTLTYPLNLCLIIRIDDVFRSFRCKKIINVRKKGAVFTLLTQQFLFASLFVQILDSHLLILALALSAHKT
ncbi:hypothetical protein ACJX0J_028098, partial [Zea mays]